MTRLSVLADEHVKRSYVRALRAHGFDVVAVAETEESGLTDERHLETSRERNLVILTNDDDFVRLARRHDHAGVIFYSDQNHKPGDIVTAIRRIDQRFSPDGISNHVEWLENWL